MSSVANTSIILLHFFFFYLIFLYENILWLILHLFRMHSSRNKWWFYVGDKARNVIMHAQYINDISMNKFTMVVHCTHCMRCDEMKLNAHRQHTYQTMRAPILNRVHLSFFTRFVCVGAWRISKRIAQHTYTRATYKGAQQTNATI